MGSLPGLGLMEHSITTGYGTQHRLNYKDIRARGKSLLQAYCVFNKPQ